MPQHYNYSLFLAIKPRTLREFYEKVLNQILPPMHVVGELYEALGLGPRAWYLGTAEQNMRMLRELRSRAQMSSPPG